MKKSVNELSTQQHHSSWWEKWLSRINPWQEYLPSLNQAQLICTMDHDQATISLFVVIDLFIIHAHQLCVSVSASFDGFIIIKCSSQTIIYLLWMWIVSRLLFLHTKHQHAEATWDLILLPGEWYTFDKTIYSQCSFNATHVFGIKRYERTVICISMHNAESCFKDF